MELDKRYELNLLPIIRLSKTEVLKHLFIAFFLIFLIPSTGIAKKTGAIVKKIDRRSAVVLYQHCLYFECVYISDSDFKKRFDSYFTDSIICLKKYKKSSGFYFRKKVVRVPFDQLNCPGKQHIIKVIFPKDKVSGNTWNHHITFDGPHGETLWRIAFWFTGSGTNCKLIQKSSHVNPKRLIKNTTIRIPVDLLSNCFKPDQHKYPIRVDNLVYKKDSQGLYAEYLLKAGQTIYTHVVLQYTAQITAEDVLDAARLVLKRSGLKSFHDIPANTTLKIPEEIISPQFLPPEHPRRMQFEQTSKASQQFHKNVKTKHLEGVTIVLDSGHGGVDPGALGINKIKEDEYVYDVMCRIKHLLETTTKANVYTTTYDDETQYTIRNSKKLDSKNDKEKILTHPPYYISDSIIGINFRYFLANYLFSQKTGQKNHDEKFIFTSFHADSLHPKAEGLMIYIPGADYYSGNCKKTGRTYLSRKEVKNHNSVKMSRKDQLKAEGFSSKFANQILVTCRKHNVPLHSKQPIRKFIVRKHRNWVPAILRHCKIPVRVLIELANLQNKNDQKRLITPEYREKLAQIYVESLIEYFENNGK